MANRPDNFLAAAIKPRRERLVGYRDGFRLGVGFMLGTLVVAMMLGLASWVLLAVVKVG
jgi:hypothetical protein